MSGSEDSGEPTPKNQIITDRDLTPTCQWCGTKHSKTWRHVIATGKFYCSDDCRNAAYYQCFISMAILSIIGLPSSIIAYLLLPTGDFRDFMLYLFYISIVGIVAGLAYTVESKKVRLQLSKNSKSMKISETE
jgi:hypothetical protein